MCSKTPELAAQKGQWEQRHGPRPRWDVSGTKDLWLALASSLSGEASLFFAGCFPLMAVFL